jgi:hypothetical protein
LESVGSGRERKVQWLKVGFPAVRSHGQDDRDENEDQMNLQRSQMLFADDLELMRAVTLNPMLNPSEPGAQLLEEPSGPCPVQLDHNGSIGRADCS